MVEAGKRTCLLQDKWVSFLFTFLVSSLFRLKGRTCEPKATPFILQDSCFVTFLRIWIAVTDSTSYVVISITIRSVLRMMSNYSPVSNLFCASTCTNLNLTWRPNMYLHSKFESRKYNTTSINHEKEYLRYFNTNMYSNAVSLARKHNLYRPSKFG